MQMLTHVDVDVCICIMLTIGSSPNHHPALCDSVGPIAENARGYYRDKKSNEAHATCMHKGNISTV